MSKQHKGFGRKPRADAGNSLASRHVAAQHLFRDNQKGAGAQALSSLHPQEDQAAPPPARASSAARAGRAVAGAVCVAGALVGGAVRGIQSMLVAAALRGNVGSAGNGEGELLLGTFPTEADWSKFFAGVADEYRAVRNRALVPTYVHAKLRALWADAVVAQATEAAAAAAQATVEEAEEEARLQTIAVQALADAEAQTRMAILPPTDAIYDADVIALERELDAEEEAVRQAEPGVAAEQGEQDFEEYVQQEGESSEPLLVYNPVLLESELPKLLPRGSPCLLARFLDSDIMHDHTALALGRA
ncbi:hypothetical protein B484DRAFT_460649, partial [Ochromonadaceae sp. CCMP2298]